MKNLYIVGASGCGREVLNIIKDIHAIRGVQWNIVGFLDDDLQALDSIDCDYQVVGTIKDYLPQANDVLALGIASPQIKENCPLTSTLVIGLSSQYAYRFFSPSISRLSLKTCVSSALMNLRIAGS